jgi:hypothetical protein
MNNDDREHLFDVLESELRFLEKGGYAKGNRTKWRPLFMFEDSPTCPNYSSPMPLVPCTNCVLYAFVPLARQNETVPCRHIVLNDYGETIDSLYRYGTEEELESAMIGWLKKTIQALGAELVYQQAQDIETRSVGETVSANF